VRSATIARPVELSGRGLFSGEPCRATLLPSEAGSGIVFETGGARIPAHPAYCLEQANCTALSADGAQVVSVEHMLAALWAAGIDTLRIEVAGPEMPNRDGSALPLYEVIAWTGKRELGERPALALAEPGKAGVGDERGSYIELAPGKGLTVDYHFSHPVLGDQRLSLSLTREDAVREVLPARSFATVEEALALASAGLLRNTHEEDALLIRDGVATQPLRFRDEYARHKILDLLGDLYLAPYELTGHITAVRSGHQLNRKLARELLRASSQ